MIGSLSRIMLVTMMLCVVTVSSAGQQPAINEVGLLTYGSYQGGDVDQVDLKSGNLFARIPLFSLPQVGKLSLSMSMVLNNNGFASSDVCQTFTIDPDDSNGDNDNPYPETLCWPYVSSSALGSISRPGSGFRS